MFKLKTSALIAAKPTSLVTGLFIPSGSCDKSIVGKSRTTAINVPFAFSSSLSSSSSPPRVPRKAAPRMVPLLLFPNAPSNAGTMFAPRAVLTWLEMLPVGALRVWSLSIMPYRILPSNSRSRFSSSISNVPVALGAPPEFPRLVRTFALTSTSSSVASRLFRI